MYEDGRKVEQYVIIWFTNYLKAHKIFLSKLYSFLMEILTEYEKCSDKGWGKKA